MSWINLCCQILSIPSTDMGNLKRSPMSYCNKGSKWKWIHSWRKEGEGKTLALYHNTTIISIQEGNLFSSSPWYSGFMWTFNNANWSWSYQINIKHLIDISSPTKSKTPHKKHPLNNPSYLWMNLFPVEDFIICNINDADVPCLLCFEPTQLQQESSPSLLRLFFYFPHI